MRLAVLLREHRGPLSADFRRFYGCNLVDALAGGVAPLRDVSAWAAHLPPESATERAIGEGFAPAPESTLWQSIEYSLRLLVWSKTKDAEDGRNHPEPFLFPWDPEPAGTYRGDVMDWQEGAHFLGWEEEMARYFKVDNDDE